MNAVIGPPPSGDVHKKVAVELIKKIPYLGKIVGYAETAWDTEKRKALDMRVHGLELWEILQNKEVKKDELEKAQRRSARGHNMTKRIALIQRELAAFDGYIKTKAMQLHDDCNAYEQAIKTVFHNKDKLCKAMRKYADDAKQGKI